MFNFTCLRGQVDDFGCVEYVMTSGIKSKHSSGITLLTLVRNSTGAGKGTHARILIMTSRCIIVFLVTMLRYSL